MSFSLSRSLTVTVCGSLLALSALSGSAAAAPPPASPPVQPDAYPTLPPAPSPSLQGGPRPAISQLPAVGPDGEVPGLRTATSNTRRRSDGTFRTTVSSAPVNVPDGHGGWVPLSTELVTDVSPASIGGMPAAAAAEPGAAPVLRTRATGFAVSLPGDLAAPVTVGQGAAAVSFRLRQVSARSAAGTSADRVVRGSTVTYRQALPKVDVAWTAVPSGLKEELRLADASAPASVSYDVSVPAASTLVPAGGGLRLLGAGGQVLAVLPAPFAFDAAGARTDAVRYALSGGAVSGRTRDYALSVATDQDWLAEPARRFPVTVDPTVYLGASRATGRTLDSAQPTRTASAAEPLSVQRTGSGTTRSLLYFDSTPSDLPPDAVVTRAQLSVFPSSFTQGAGPASRQMEAHVVTENWDAGAVSWNNVRTGTAWASAGGTADARVQDRSELTAGQGETVFDLTKAVGDWVSGAVDDQGVLLCLSDETTTGGGAFSNVDSAQPPYLLIDWTASTGTNAAQRFYDADLTDRLNVKVNLANGNLVLTQNDLQVPGPGLSSSLTRTYNSRRADSAEDLGFGWLSNAGPGVYLSNFGMSLTLYAPGGTPYVFTKTLPVYGAPVSYLSPPGINASLTYDGASTFTLTYHATGVKQVFSYGTYPRANLQSTTDRNGNTISYGYASATNPATGQKYLASMTDTAGRVTTFTRSGSGSGPYLGTVTDSSGRNTTYGYTGTDLTSVTNSSGGVTGYSYDSAHNLTRVTTPIGNSTKIAYDSSRRVTSITRVTDIGADTGPTTAFSHTAAISVKGPAARGSTVVTDPRGGSTTYAYDTADRIRTVTNQLGKAVSTDYSPNSDVTAFTGASTGTGGTAQTTVQTYDANSNLTSRRLPTGAGISYAYSGSQTYQPSSVTDSRGNATVLGYDTVGNLTSSQSGTGSSAGTERRILEGSSDPSYGGTVHCGPTVGSTITAARPGSVCEVRDGLYIASLPTRHRTAYRYDAAGNQIQQVAPSPSVLASSSRTFDSLGRVASLIDGKGQTRTLSYDAMDRLVSTTNADGRASTQQYDQDGNRTFARELAAGGTITRAEQYGYDRLNQPYSSQTPEDTAITIFDAGSNLASYSDTGGLVQYGYNAANQLISLAEPGGSCTGYSQTTLPPTSARCTLFTNDDDGRRLTTRYPGGLLQTVTADNSGRATRIRSTFGATVPVDLSYLYADPTGVPPTSGNPTSDTTLTVKRTDNSTGASDTYGYDSRSQLAADTTRNSASTITRYAGYCYDPAGNRTQLITAATGTCTSPTVTLTYDASNALTGLTGGTTTGSFGYDSNGNETSAPTNSSTGTQARSTSLNDRDQATSFTSAGATLPQTYRGGDQTGRLSTGFASTTTAALSTTSLGIARQTITNAGTTASPQYFTRDSAGTLISVRTGTAASYTSGYYLTDNLGSTLKIIDNAGATKNSYTYDAYGRTLTASAAINQPFRYTSGFYDPGTTLTKLGLRYYDPTLGRFTQPDPTGSDPHYTYTGNNPMTYTDLTGAVSFLEGTIIALGAVAIGAAILPATPIIATVGLAAGGTAFVFGTACTLNDPRDKDC